LDNKSLVRTAFREVFEENDFSESTISKYFHQNYKQIADGNQLNYEKFVKHMKELKKAIHSMKFDFQHLVSEGNAVCSVHIASGRKSDGQVVETKIIAYFEIKDGKIFYCDELSHLLTGDESDRDLASRH
jgi:ketosteroid isomerase-like protein